MKISYKPVDSDYQVLIKKDYDSWASSLYSPEGFFKYEFPMVLAENDNYLLFIINNKNYKQRSN